MKHKIALFFLFSILAWAAKVEITSDIMQAQEAKKEVHFIKNVLITQLQSWMKGDKAIVYFDENNETKQYDVIGNVTFELKETDRFYKGKANKVTYLPKDSVYVLTGNAVIDDMINKRHIDGNLIRLNVESGQADVFGDKKEPVKFIFETEDKKNKKD